MTTRGPAEQSRSREPRAKEDAMTATVPWRRAGPPAFAIGVLAAGTLGLVPPASAAPGHLAGSWSSVDVDGSHQTLRIRGAGRPVYAMTLRDDVTSGACGGPPAKVVGHAVVRGHELMMRGTLVCQRGGNPLPGQRITFSLHYDAGRDTLTDDAGVVWGRPA
jgi:hypothetical protein